MPVRSSSRFAPALLFATVVVGCGDKRAVSGSLDAGGAATPTSARASFAIGKDVTATVDLKTPAEHIKGKTSAGQGKLELDVFDLRATKGEIKVDLQSFTTQTYADGPKNEKQTGQAQIWLEAASQLPPQTTEKYRFAVFTVVSADPGASGDLRKVPATSGEGDDLKKVTLTAKGSFALHGHAVDKDIKLLAVFHYPKGAKPEALPSSIDVTTSEPFAVTLAEHEVQPRDAAGAVDKAQFNLLGTKVADVANVTVTLKALPAAR